MPWTDLPTIAKAAPAPGAADAVKKAAAVLTSLRNKRAAAEQRRVDLGAEREAIALSVHGGGHKENRARLTQINIDIATHASELASIDSAISTGAAALAAANFAAERASRRAAAEAALETARLMREAAQLAGEALQALVARVARFNDLAFECHRAGFGASLPLITANLRRSVAWGMYPIGCGEIFPVSQRVELGALLTNYSARAEAEARRVLGEGESEEAA